MKSFKTLFLSVLLLFIYSGIFSQADSIELIHHQRLDTFDISRYILPDIDYKSLNLQFNFGSYNASKNYLEKTEDYKYYFNSNLYINNFHYKNTRKLIMNGNDCLFISGSLNKYELLNFKIEEPSKQKIKSNYAGISLSTNRDYKFYKYNKIFYEVELNAQTRFYSYYQKINGEINKNKRIYFYIRPTFSIGKGRIEDVTDIWHTVRILKDFSRTGILSKNPTDTDIIELAKTLSKRRYERFFDYRVRIKENIKAIDEKIKERKLVNNHNSDYFTSLYDMYLYGALFDRYSGSYFSGGLVPFGNISKFSGTNVYSSYRYGIGLILKYVYKKPLNQFWQLGINADFRSDFTKKIYNIYHNNNISSHLLFGPNFNSSIAYYPTSRTRFKSSLDITYYFYKNLGDDSKINNDNYHIGLKNSLDYYISPRARLDFNFDIYYSCSFSYLNYIIDVNMLDPFISSNLTLKQGLNYITNIKFNYYLY